MHSRRDTSAPVAPQPTIALPADDTDDLEEKAPVHLHDVALVDIPMNDESEREHMRNKMNVVHSPARASWMPVAPTVVQLPSQHYASPTLGAHSSSSNSDAPTVHSPIVALAALGETIDVDVFNALPVELQHEILAERAAQLALTAAYNSPLEHIPITTVDNEDDGHADALHSDRCWTCRVCTFANHPQLTECEICETPNALPSDSPIDTYIRPRTSSSSSVNELYTKLSQRFGAASLTKSLQRIRVPATPAATTFTRRVDPTADDVLVVATAKVQQLQTSASETLRHAKQTILAHTSARRSSINAQLPSLAAIQQLESLQRALNRKCEPGDVAYEQLLQRLWAAVYQDDSSHNSRCLSHRAFERVSDGWLTMGFQGTNPDTDFRGGGVLALQCLVRAFEAFPQPMRAIVAAQQPVESTNASSWYPVCVAGVNVTCLLASALALGTGQYSTTPAPFWQLLEDPLAFDRLFFYTFIKMDATWRRMNASPMEFNMVLKATRRIVTFMLAQGPATLADLRIAADKTFIDRFVRGYNSKSLADSENGECPDPFNVLDDDDDNDDAVLHRPAVAPTR